VSDAAAAIRAGQPVVLPTDTVYGLCGDAEREAVAHEVARLKGRAERQPIALLAGEVDRLLERVPELDRGPLDALLPGPYTLVLPNPRRRYPWLTGGSATIGVRIPDLPPAAAEVLGEVGAVFATSANAHGGPDPRRVEDVPEEIRAACGAVVDSGELPGTPSTVLDLTGPQPRVLREGAAPAGEALSRLRRSEPGAEATGSE
jgi:L-threonylcarbamoyladenylate synthase